MFSTFWYYMNFLFRVVNGGLKWIGVASFDLIDINGTCEVDGKILTLPISGSGNCDIRLGKLQIFKY